MNIRLAAPADLDRIEDLYAIGRAYMRSTGNMNQWINGYPQREMLEEDIQKQQLFVLESETGLHGVFAFILGEDPTYGYIDGAWPNAKPYGTIHRIASDGTVKGFVSLAKGFAMQYTDEIRVDTHHDNHTMQHVVEKNGFRRCGIIYLENGDPRIAYQWSKEA
ncbi:MAG: GNAT family N-acetyltransferase [Clostridia bacterium]|nr:GNAT family N-acetyltransferase [Clostridia bacterium]